MNKLLALALLALMAEGTMIAEVVYTNGTSSNCCPAAQPYTCCAKRCRMRCCNPRPRRARCMRICRPKRICCPRMRCCRPRPRCCRPIRPLCDGPACIVAAPEQITPEEGTTVEMAPEELTPPNGTMTPEELIPENGIMNPEEITPANGDMEVGGSDVDSEDQSLDELVEENG